MDDILNKVIQVSGATLEEIVSPCRKQKLVAARLLFVLKACKQHYHPTEIGERIDRKRPTIINIRNGKYKPSSEYFVLLRLYDSIQ